MPPLETRIVEQKPGFAPALCAFEIHLFLGLRVSAKSPARFLMAVIIEPKMPARVGIEVFNLDLSSCSLVTLSACETGRAVIGGVDEVIGLGRGFLYAGAASLLPTLWKVDDASSAELMELFYQNLLSKQTKAAALAKAQREFVARARAATQPYRVHPYFWAAFHLIGDYGPVLKVEV